MGSDLITELQRGTSLLVISQTISVDLVLQYIKKNRDCDILEEPLGILLLISNIIKESLFFIDIIYLHFLGEIIDRNLVTSDEFIPQRMVKKIEQVTLSMVEYGFGKFYDSISDFNRQLYVSFRRGYKEKDDDLLLPITIEQIWPVIIIVLSLNGIATIIFVAEILYYKWRNWRNCKC